MKYIVRNYHSLLNLKETEIAIKLVKDTFERKLAYNLDLLRVSAPLFVDPNTGLNDNLSGKEKAVSFKVMDNMELEIVQSLAKWKRYALKKYNFDVHKGLYTDMNAIRPNEDLDNMHSCYVDQWDWEKVITKEDRTIDYLKKTVRLIYKALKETIEVVKKEYPILNTELPDDIYFITAEELLALYPDKDSKEREHLICKEHKAVFLIGIGDKLKNNESHDTRAADYDDWKLNGDLLLYYDMLDIAFELSSMGIRVNKESLMYQLKAKNEEFKLPLMYHQAILNDELPLTIGGGIGQSRICMFILKKVHIGEVQSSYWNHDYLKELEKDNIHLL